MLISSSQRSTLFAVIRDAALATGETPDVYRHRVMREELGVEHLSQVSRTTGFDTLMARVCNDAGHYARAVCYTQSAFRRLRHLVEDAAEAIAPGHALDYIAGVMVQSRFVTDADRAELASALAVDSGWSRFTMAQLRKILMMLKMQLRRSA